MAIIDIQSFTPGKGFYKLDDKLIRHVQKRAEEGFRRNQEKREKINSEEAHKQVAAELTDRFIESMGGIPYDPSLPLNVRITGQIGQESYTIEKVIFESRPGVYVTANVYVPKTKAKTHGAVLFQCGHSYTAKAMERYQAAAAIIASCGLTVLAMDPIGQGERKMYVEPDGTLQLPGSTIEHNHVGQQCFLTGDSLTRYFVADAMRAVDYLMTRPEVDPARVGATGCSGGGTQTCVLAVCDRRIAAAAPSCFLSTREHIMQSGGVQDAEQHWLNGAVYGFDHHEVLTCFAPRPMLLLTAEKDFFPIEGAEEIYRNGKKLWEMYGTGEALRIFTDDCFHSYSENMAMEAGRFFAEVLNGDRDTEVDPSKIKILPEQELYCTESGYVALDHPDCVFPFAENLERYHEKRKQLTESDRGKLRQKVYDNRLPVELHARCLTSEVYNGLDMKAYMWFSQKELPCYGVLFESSVKKQEKRNIRICLWKNGTDELLSHIRTIRKICASGDCAFVVDLAGMGKLHPPALLAGESVRKDARFDAVFRLNCDLMVMGDSLCALRSYDLVRTVEMLKGWEDMAEVSLYAENIGCVYARILQLLEPWIKTELVDEVSPVEVVADKYYEEYGVSEITLPGLALYY